MVLCLAKKSIIKIRIFKVTWNFWKLIIYDSCFCIKLKYKNNIDIENYHFT